MATVTSAELQAQLEQLANDLGVSLQEILAAFYTKGEIDTTVAGITSRLDAIDVIDATDGVETLAEKVKAINALLTDPANNTLATDLLNRIATNASGLSAEATRATAAEAALQSAIDTNSNGVAQNASNITNLAVTVSDNKSATDLAISDMGDRVTATEGDLTTLKGDKTVTGSIANQIDAEATRAKAVEAANQAAQAATQAQVDTLNGDSTVAGSVDSKISSAVSNITVAASTADAAQNTRLDALEAAGTALDGRVATVEDVLNDTTDANGDIVKGVKTKVSDLEAGLIANQADQDAKNTAMDTRV